jgi:hypothetical protein
MSDELCIGGAAEGEGAGERQSGNTNDGLRHVDFSQIDAAVRLMGNEMCGNEI